MSGTRVIREAENTDQVFLGEFVDFGKGYLMAIPKEHRWRDTVTYALPDPQPADPEFRHAIDRVTHRFVLGHIRGLSAPRNVGDKAPLPTTEFVYVHAWGLRPATIEEVAANV